MKIEHTKYITKRTKVILSLLVFLFIISSYTFSQPKEKAPILILSSYNPETSSVSAYISNFINEYKQKEDDRAIIIENMNCKSFSESPLWTNLMRNMLFKFSKMNPKPAVIILLGQEAFTSYLSQPISSLCGIPVMCGMVSRNSIQFPIGDFNPELFEPRSIDALRLTSKYHIVGGYMYEYNIEKNLQLIHQYFPNTKKLAFLTDNSCGGLCLRSYIRFVMQSHPQYESRMLDGRTNTVYSMINELAKLSNQTTLVLGTWRIDKNEGFFLHNSAYLMKDVNPKIPVFSLSTIGVGDWAIGGFSPAYRNTGKDIADDVYRYLFMPNHGNVQINVLPSKYTFDVKALQKHHLDVNSLPKGSTLINKPDNFWVKYQSFIIFIIIAFIVLSSIILVLIYFLLKINKLKNNLQTSQTELVKAKEKAEEANTLKSAFVANMSHEIRTPLNAIVGFSNLLATSDIPEEEHGKFTAIIQQNSNLLLNLINDVLSLSQLEANHATFIFEPTDVIELCKSVLLTTKMARPSDLDYRFESRFDRRIELLDTQRMQQILINLLTNASKFTEKGSITLSFDVDEEKEQLYFTVTDTGCGIPLDKQDLVFKRFEKLNRYIPGTGLGLPICQMTIERLGGKIWIDSTYTDGARFIFYLPIKQEEGEKEEEKDK